MIKFAIRFKRPLAFLLTVLLTVMIYPAIGPTNSALARFYDLAITKADSPDPVTAGEDLTYTVTVTNNGPDRAYGVVVTDTLPAGVTYVSAAGSQGTASYVSGVVTWELGILSRGASATLTIIVTVDVETRGTLTNTAEVSSMDTDTNLGNNTVTEDTTVRAYTNLWIDKDDDTDPLYPGDTLTYTVAVGNGGPHDASGVVVEDTLPAGVTFVSAVGSQGTATHTAGIVAWDIGELANGATATLTIVVTIDADTEGTITNTAVVSGDDTDPNPGNNTASEDTVVNTKADLAITKFDNPDPVIAGEELIYTVEVMNYGPSDASGVVVTETLPVGLTYVSAVGSQGTATYDSPAIPSLPGVVTWDVGELADGATATLTIVVVVDSGTESLLANTASVTGNDYDPDTTNNTAKDGTVVNTETDLAITKADSPDPVIAGEELTYTVEVINNGPSDASGVVVTDTLPEGVSYVSNYPTQGTATHTAGVVTWDVGELGSGASATLTIVVTVGSGTEGPLANTASVTGNEYDPDESNNTVTESTGADTRADLEVTKVDSSDPVIAGEELTYTVTVTNNGPSDASGVVVTDTLPAGVTFDSASVTAGADPTHIAGVVTWNVGELADGATATLTIVVTVDADTEGTITNTAVVSGDDTDPDESNNTATEDTVVNTEADLVITKSDSPDPVIAGQGLTYTVVVTNNGPSDASGVEVTDTLPAGVTFDSASVTAGADPTHIA
ncbi:MAG: DUF11 domain-containing protein, partial [Dehalococcoidales bacterium]